MISRLFRSAVAATTIATALTVSAGALAAQDEYLSVDGIKGESVDAQFKDQIDVQAFAFGVSTGQTSSNGVAQKGIFDLLSVSKRTDKATPALILAAATNQRIPTVTLSVRRSGDAKAASVFLKVKLTDVLVSSVKVASGVTEVTETVTFNFSQIEIEYSVVDAKGVLSAPVKAGFNVKTNTQI